MKNNIPESLLYICTIFLYTSCIAETGLKTDDKAQYVINLDSISVNGEFVYSSLYKSVKPIFLETTDISLIGAINKMRVFDSFIYILDAHIAKSLFVFDMKGHFVRKIGNVGQGPGEYTSPSDFAINTDDKTIYILDDYAQRINKYDLSTGAFIHSIPLERNVRSYNIEYSGGKLYADAYFWKFSDNNYLLRMIHEPSGKAEGKYLKIKEYAKGVSNTFWADKLVFYRRENGNLIFAQQFMDKMVEIKGDTIAPLLAIKGKDCFTSKELQVIIQEQDIPDIRNIIAADKVYRMGDFIEHGDWIIFSYNQGSTFIKVLLNKKTQEISIPDKQWNDLLMKEKTSGGILPSMGCTDEHGVYYYYVDQYNMSSIRQLAHDGALAIELEFLDKIKELNDDSNPFLLYYEFKD